MLCDDVHFLPTSHLVLSHWQVEISCGGNIYTMVISKYYKPTPSQSWVVNIYKYTTDWGHLPYQFARAAITKYQKLGGLKQQKCIASQFWGQEVQDQGVGWVGSFLEALSLFLATSWFLVFATSPWHSLAYRCIIPISAFIFTGRSPCVCLHMDIFLLCLLLLIIRTPIILD